VYEIPGLEPITYEGKKHFVPWLARPIFPPWERGWNDPRFHRAAPIHEQTLYKEEPCYIFHQRCRLLEGEVSGQTGGDAVPGSAVTPSLGKFLPLEVE
jgi:large subunit ribosomal protein L37